MLKMKLNFTKSELSTFVQKMKSFIGNQEANVQSAFCGHGKYTLHPHFNHLMINEDAFYELSQHDREAIIQVRVEAAIKLLNSPECPDLSLAEASVPPSLSESPSPMEIPEPKMSSSATQPLSSATQPLSLATQPSSSATQPSSSATQPSSSATQPSSSATQPLSSTTQPSSSATQPSSSTTQPSSSTTEPSSSATQPSSSTTQLSSLATQPLSSATQPSSSAIQLSSSATQWNLSVSCLTLHDIHIPWEIIDGIWRKVAKLVFTPESVTGVPGGNSSHHLVASTSAERPHPVKPGKEGIFICDGCVNFKGLRGLCSHVVTAAELSGHLVEFVTYYRKLNYQPNFTATVLYGLPSHVGRKGSLPPRKRKSKEKPPFSTSIPLVTPPVILLATQPAIIPCTTMSAITPVATTPAITSTGPPPLYVHHLVQHVFHPPFPQLRCSHFTSHIFEGTFVDAMGVCEVTTNQP